MPGWLALIGGAEWREGCDFDAKLLQESGGNEVLVLPTAAAYEHPDRAVEWASRWFSSLGAHVRGHMVLSRAEADDPAYAAVVRDARFVYLGGGSPMHLRAVLKASAVWDALESAWADGAVIAGASAGGMVLGDPMVDPRGGAFTLGLGLRPGVSLLPHADTWSGDKLRRTLKIAGDDITVAAVDERTALLRSPSGEWSVAGAGTVRVYRKHAEVALSALP